MLPTVACQLQYCLIQNKFYLYGVPPGSPGGPPLRHLQAVLRLCAGELSVRRPASGSNGHPRFRVTDRRARRADGEAESSEHFVHRTHALSQDAPGRRRRDLEKEWHSAFHFPRGSAALVCVECMEKRNREAPISCFGTTETLCLMLYCDDDSNRLKPTPLTEFRYDDLPPDMPQRVWVRHPALARGYWQRPAASGACRWFQRRLVFSWGHVFAPRWLARIHWSQRRYAENRLAMGQHPMGRAGPRNCMRRQRAGIGGGRRERRRRSGGDRRLSRGGAGTGRDSTPARDGGNGHTLPGHKRPRWAHWVDALPRTVTGKLRRAAPATLWQAIAELF